MSGISDLPTLLASLASVVFAQVDALISLSVHSDLQAVDLTAAIAGALTERGIRANIATLAQLAANNQS